MIPNDDLENYIVVHEAGRQILRDFCTEASKYNDSIRSSLSVDERLGAPHVYSGESAEHSWQAWHIDTDTVVIPETYDTDDIELPLGVLTGEVSPVQWVDKQWEDRRMFVADLKARHANREVSEMKRLIERHPDEARKALDE